MSDKEQLPVGNMPPEGFVVGTNGSGISIMIPPRGNITKDQALNLAAWLVALADPDRERFDRFFTAVCNT